MIETKRKNIGHIMKYTNTLKEEDDHKGSWKTLR